MRVVMNREKYRWFGVERGLGKDALISTFV